MWGRYLVFTRNIYYTAIYKKIYKVTKYSVWNSEDILKYWHFPIIWSNIQQKILNYQMTLTAIYILLEWNFLYGKPRNITTVFFNLSCAVYVPSEALVLVTAAAECSNEVRRKNVSQKRRVAHVLWKLSVNIFVFSIFTISKIKSLYILAGKVSSASWSQGELDRRRWTSQSDERAHQGGKNNQSVGQGWRFSRKIYFSGLSLIKYLC